jgi:hypothetical protein
MKRITDYFLERKLFLGIILAVIIALTMTAVSLKLYDLDDVSRLDVSLPNRESIRSSIKETDSQSFGSTGVLDSKAIGDFQALFTKNRSALDALGKFDSDALSDASLQVGANE